MLNFEILLEFSPELKQDFNDFDGIIDYREDFLAGWLKKL